jgi:gliding motility-associated-like protein
MFIFLNLLMRFNPVKLFLLVLLAIACVQAKAQTSVCNGSYGDPVVKLDFGSGVSYTGPPLAPGITTMNYISGCPNDTYYSIVSSQTLCHNDTWHTVLHDHTGNAGGYMMLVNASYEPSVFFTEAKDLNLCENTTYEFSAYVLNLMKLSASDASIRQPDLLFTIKKPDGTILAQKDTYTIQPTADPQWNKYSVPFSTGAGVTQIVLEISNNGPGGNGNDLLLDDIEFRACGPNIKLGFTTVDDTQPKNTCKGQVQNYNLIADLNNGYSNPKEQWQSSTDGGVTWVNIPGATNLSYSFQFDENKPVGTYLYRMAAAEGDNINSPNCRVYSDVRTVTVNAYLDKPSVAAPPVCEGDALTLTANAPGAVSYEWTGPGVTAANKNQNPLVIDNATVAAAGDYQVTVVSAGGCPTPSDKVKATVNLKPVIPAITPAPICKGSATILNETTPNAKSYSWLPVTGLSDPTAASPAAKPAETTTYTVTVTSNEGCTATQTVTVTVMPVPEASISPQKKIFEGQSVVLDAEAKYADTYLWTPADGLDDPTKLNPVASPTDDITYTLKASSGIGCGFVNVSVFVRVYKKIVIPTSFSPNGDGLNDYWDIEALSTYPQSTMNVFNRSGQKVYTSTGYDKPWNGTYKGYILPSGTYYYVIDLKSGAPLLSGWVLIVH